MGALVLLGYAWIFSSAMRTGPWRDIGLAYGLLLSLIGIAVTILIFGSVGLWLAALVLLVPALALLGLEVFHGNRLLLKPVPFPWPRGWIEIAALSATIIALLLGLLQALAPPTSWDAAVAHLALPADFTRLGRIAVFDGNPYSGYPLLVHCLYTFGFQDGGEASAQFVAWIVAALACVMVFDLGNQLAGRRAGYLAAAILATAPIFAQQCGVASLDVALAAVVAGGLAQWLRWHETENRRALVLAGLLCGSACGIRHTGFLVCALVFLGTLIRSTWVKRSGVALRAPGLLVVSMLVAAAPWVVRSLLATGNPVYPFFMNIFGHGAVYHTEITALGAHESIKGSGFWYFLTFPWNLIMHPDRFDGWSNSPGGLVLILGVPGLLMGGRKARWLGAFSVCGLIAFYHFQHLARYMLPFFVPMMAVAAVPCVTKGWRKLAVPVWAVSAAMGLVVAGAVVHFKIPAALGIEDRQSYLTRRVERYPAFAWINDSLPADAHVLTLDPRSYYIDRPTFQNYDALKAIRDWPNEKQREWLKDHNLSYLLYPQAYLQESPGFGQKGYLDQFERWRRDAEHFQLVKRFELPRPKGGPNEVVEIYEIQWE